MRRGEEGVPRTQRSASSAVRCRAGAVTNGGVWYGPGSAEQREERCTASGTRLCLLFHRRDDGRMLELRDVHFLRQQPGLREGVVHGLDCREIGRGAGIAAEIIVLQEIG